jgi:hypothetical protein
LADCILNQIRWHHAHAETNQLEYLNLVRKAVHWWNGRQMDRYIGNELDKRYSEYEADSDGKRTKAAMDLVLRGYLPDKMNSMPALLFAGHDSLAQIREEHDKVFVKELTTIPSMLKSRAHLTNDLPHTTTVIRKPLRPFAP